MGRTFLPDGHWTIHGPVSLSAALLAGIGAYLSVRFPDQLLQRGAVAQPFCIYCLVAGVASCAYLVLK